MISSKLTIVILLLSAGFAGSSLGQSSDQNFPSAVTQSEIASTIRARDLGDARLTTHYWVFDGEQGDIFINVVTRNFSGDIDVYQASDLKPLTKMVMYADNGVSETGRVIYLRQPGRLLLRVQGRTPNDDPANYSIKFAGSFVALAPQKQDAPPMVAETEDTGIKVNSVGTIIAVTPKQPPVAIPSPERVREAPVSTAKASPPAKRVENEVKSEEADKSPVKTDDSNVRTVFGNKAAKVTVSKPVQSATADPPVRKTPPPSRSTGRRPENATPDPMAGYRLVIIFKDGTRVEREMIDVVRFVYDRGVLSILGKDGSIDRYPATTVASVTVQQP